MLIILTTTTTQKELTLLEILAWIKYIISITEKDREPFILGYVKDKGWFKIHIKNELGYVLQAHFILMLFY